MASSSKPAKDQSERIAQIVKAVEGFDLVNSSAWQALGSLSSNTYVDGIEVDPDGVILKSDSFTGPISIYLLLRYATGDEKFEMSDAFMGEFTGHFDKNKKPVIDDVTVDTSPFYEGDEESSQN